MLGARLRPERDGGSEPHRRLYYSGQPRSTLRSPRVAVIFNQLSEVARKHDQELRRTSTFFPRLQGRDTPAGRVPRATCWSFAFQGHGQYSDTVNCEPAPCPACARIRRDESAQAHHQILATLRSDGVGHKAWAFVHPFGTRWSLPASSIAGRDADGLRAIAAAPGITGEVSQIQVAPAVTVKPKCAQSLNPWTEGSR